jgi:hypothetical protein
LQVLPGVLNADQKVANWLGVLIILLIATMNSSAVDSFQNGMAATIGSYFFKNWKHSMIWTRVAVFLCNVPIIAVATKGYSVNEVSSAYNAQSVQCSYLHSGALILA